MSDLSDLIARLEAATEGSRALDCEVALAVGWTTRIHKPQTNYDMEWVEWLPPRGKLAEVSTVVDRYTRSIDAALTLVPAGFDYGFSYSKKDGLEAWVQRPFREGICHQGYAPEGADDDKTRALAICIAALKARADNERPR